MCLFQKLSIVSGNVTLRCSYGRLLNHNFHRKFIFNWGPFCIAISIFQKVQQMSGFILNFPPKKRNFVFPFLSLDSPKSHARLVFFFSGFDTFYNMIPIFMKQMHIANGHWNVRALFFGTIWGKEQTAFASIPRCQKQPWCRPLPGSSHFSFPFQGQVVDASYHAACAMNITRYGGFPGGTPKWMVQNGKSYQNGWSRGIPTLGNLHMNDITYASRKRMQTPQNVPFMIPPQPCLIVLGSKLRNQGVKWSGYW